MRFTSFAILAMLGVLCAPVAGQCTLPYNEDFETASGTTFPAGWSNDLIAGTYPWTADSGGTPSTNTGPSIDHNPGTSAGIYLFYETSSSPTGALAVLNSPVYDVSSLANPCVTFWYHMYGAAMGTLSLEVWDGAAWFPAWSMTGNQGDVWMSANVPLLVYADAGCSFPQASKFRFVGADGTSFTSDMALDDITVAECPLLAWEPNDPIASLDIDGVQADPFLSAAIVSKTSYICGGVAAPVTSVYTLGSNLPGNTFDIVVSGAPLVPASPGGGGLPLADGQLINIDLFGAPFSFVGGGLPLLLPLSNLPGVNDVTVTVTTSVATASTTSAQAVVFDPMAPLGFVLSQGVQLDVAVLPAQPMVAGPTTSTGIVSVDVVNSPTCWSSTGGVPFYGTSYSTINVSASGGVQFGGSDTDTSPSVVDAFSDDGRVAFWTALDPSEGGTVTISSPMQDIIRVDWAGVFYDGGGPGVTFGIQLDCVTGVITLDGLQGIAPNPTLTSTTDDQMLLISPGITVPFPTVPPPAGFGLGLNGSATFWTDMLYEFNDVSVSAMGVPASIAGGMDVLTFTPMAIGMGTGYIWAGT